MDLVSHIQDSSGVRSDEDSTSFLQLGSKVCVFRQESVTGMNLKHNIYIKHTVLAYSLSAGLLDSFQNSIGSQVTLTGRSRSNTDCFVGKLDVKGIGVDIRVDGDRLDSHGTSGLDDTASNLASVGDEDLLELGFIWIDGIQGVKFFVISGLSSSHIRETEIRVLLLCKQSIRLIRTHSFEKLKSLTGRIKEVCLLTAEDRKSEE